MSAGMLHSWYLGKIAKATNPFEYFLAMQEYMLYELNVFSFNTKKYFQKHL
jgi:hypothetical protein